MQIRSRHQELHFERENQTDFLILISKVPLISQFLMSCFSKLKCLPSFCFLNAIPDDLTPSNNKQLSCKAIILELTSHSFKQSLGSHQAVVYCVSGSTDIRLDLFKLKGTYYMSCYQLFQLLFQMKIYSVFVFLYRTSARRVK